MNSNKELDRQRAHGAKHDRVEAADQVRSPIAKLWLNNVARDIKNAYSPITAADPVDTFSVVYKTSSKLMGDAFLGNSNGLSAFQGLTLMGLAAGVSFGVVGGGVGLGEILLNTHTYWGSDLVAGGVVLGGIGLVMEVGALAATFLLPLVPALVSPFIKDLPQSALRTTTQLVEYARFDNGVSRRRNS